MKRFTNISVPKTNSEQCKPYTIIFVYSPVGNFCIKGYYHDVNKYMLNFPKYIARYTFWKNGVHHGYWSGSKDISIREPSRRTNWDYYTGKCNTIIEKKYTITIGKKVWKLRRIPSKWIFG